MTRTVGALATMLAGTSHTRCGMMLLGMSDGTFIGITDHDEAIDYDLTEAGSGSVTYSAGSGILPSDVVLSMGLDADNYEVKGPLGGKVLREHVLGARFDRARCWLFQIDHTGPAGENIPIIAGSVTECRIEGGRFVFQVRGDTDRLNQSIGRIITPYCDADFGDARCTVTPESIVGTVTAIGDQMIFTVSFAGAYADGYFNQGTVEPLTGDLVGIRPVEIFTWTAAGVITLFAPLSGLPTFGDTFTIKRGCGKTRDDCVAYDNINNFRGFPEMPGTDQVLRYPIPGEGGTG